MNTHSKAVGRDCVKRATSKYGPGWRYLSEEQQRGAIALEIVSVVLSCITMTDDQSSVAMHCRDVATSALYPISADPQTTQKKGKTK